MLAVNPSSGPDGDTAPLVEAAERAGVSVVVLDPDGDIAEELTRALPDDLAVLGMAGGDGTLSLAAAICIDRDIPLVCVPFRTRNHFARDLGLDRRDPCVAIEAFADGVERRVDVGDLSGRLFLNNVTFGVYAEAVDDEGASELASQCPAPPHSSGSIRAVADLTLLTAKCEQKAVMRGAGRVLGECRRA